MGRSLYSKVWEKHSVRTLSSGQTQLFIGLHLIHEVTSPQAFGMLMSMGLKVPFPHRTFATVDHIIPTNSRARPFHDPLAEEMMSHLQKNCDKFNIQYFNIESGMQGIVHVVGPEQGLTQPGMTIACGDSHTSTHGAFGALAFGIGTSQVRDVLATQTLAMTRSKVRRINLMGKLRPGVYAKDVILHLIRVLGVNGGIGYAYEYGGPVVEAMSMEERMTLCNMSIEGGARIGYVNPDEKTFAYLKGRPHAPKNLAWDEALKVWGSVASDPNAVYDDEVTFDGNQIAPTLTWGINPGQAISIHENIPSVEGANESDRASLTEALDYMKLRSAQPIRGTKINVAFIGSCTNGRLSDLEEVAKHVRGHRVAKGVKAFVVPGSMQVKVEAEKLGLDQVFRESGFEWREPGCSMCLAMNPDKLKGDEICASSSNRNFKGRQGSPTGRTLLMSPVMVAASAIAGEVTDPREIFSL